MTKHTLLSNAAYWTYHDSKLPTIIMIHGFRGTHHGLDLIAKKLPGFHIIVPDLPGFGETAALEREHSLDNYVKWLHDFITDLKLGKRPFLLGHSFGSIVCAAYAARYPKSVDKLILVNPIGAPALEGPRAILTKLALFYYSVGRKLPPNLERRWLSLKVGVIIITLAMAKTRDKAKRRYIHDQHLQYFSRFNDLRALKESFATSVGNTVRQSAPNITIPTLLIAGEHDDITPLDKQKLLLDLFSNASLKVIKQTGHLTHYETPDQVAKLVQDFIKLE